MTKMGFKRDPSQKRKPIKAVSKKQRLRTSSLQANFQRVLGVQRELYGENFCQPGAGEWREKCPNNKGKRYPLVPDHVNTRNGKDVDRHGNLQPACSWCNFQKGSKRIDFRPPEMVAACEGLDKKVGADLKKCSNN